MNYQRGSALMALVALTVWAQPHNREVLRAVPVNEAPAAVPIAQKQSKYYLIVKEEWDESDEQEFGDFVAALGASGCGTLADCLKSKANPYRDSDPEDIRPYSDCADFPLMLRAYYAWKRGLPFSVASAIHSNDPPPASGAGPTDYRYTEHGNQIATRKSFAAQPIVDASGQVLGGAHATIEDIWDYIENVVSSSMYRTDPRQESTKNFSDFYTPALERDVIRPGTVLYAPQGHAAIVHRVAPNGDVFFLQASTDGGVSRLVFNKASFPQSRIEHGAGFKNFRPQRLVGAKANAEGILLGGSIQGMSDDELRQRGKFSLDQYRSQDGKYDYNDQKLYWDEYVTARLSGKKWMRDPLRDLSKRIQTLCTQVKNRITQVETGVAQGLPNAVHPERLPAKIYGAEEVDWEKYSSPGRDADLRSGMADLVAFAGDMIALSATELKKTAYKGSDIKADLLREYSRQSAECKMEYTNSKGQKVPLDLTTVIARAEKISFDPYHCPELRWGAEGAELESCIQDASSGGWYAAQAPLRQQRSRDNRGFYGYTLEESGRAFKSMEVQKTSFDIAAIF